MNNWLFETISFYIVVGCINLDSGLISWKYKHSILFLLYWNIRKSIVGNIVFGFPCRDSDILSKSGVDAVHYLSFQRHVIAFMCVVSVIRCFDFPKYKQWDG